MTTPFDQPSSTASADPEGGSGAYSYDGKPDRWKRYRLPDPVTGKPGGFTRATTFAKSISDTYALSMWGLRMGGLGLCLRPDLYARMASTSPDDKETQNQIMEQAKEAAGAKIGANLGTALHAFSEALDRGEDPNIPPPYRPHMAAHVALREQFGLEMVDIEQVVLCTTTVDLARRGDKDPHEVPLNIAGTFDRIVRFTRDVTVELVGGGTYTFTKGTLAILDLKTGKDLQYGWLEISIQLAIYSRAERIWDKEKLAYRPMPEGIDQNVALVVHLPATAPGESVKATMYAVNIADGWEESRLCLEVREARKKKGRATALAVVEEAPIDAEPVDLRIWKGSDPGVPVTDEVRPPTLYERALDARTRDDLTTIWFDAVKTRQDTAEFREVIQRRQAALLADSAAG